MSFQTLAYVCLMHSCIVQSFYSAWALRTEELCFSEWMTHHWVTHTNFHHNTNHKHPMTDTSTYFRYSEQIWFSNRAKSDMHSEDHLKAICDIYSVNKICLLSHVNTKKHWNIISPHLISFNFYFYLYLFIFCLPSPCPYSLDSNFSVIHYNLLDRKTYLPMSVI